MNTWPSGPVNGGRPASMYQSVMPRLYMSERMSRSFSSSCSGLAYWGVPTKPPIVMCALPLAAGGRTRQPEIDDLDDEPVLFVVLVLDHDVGRLDVTMDEPLLAGRAERAGNLQSDLEGVVARGSSDRLP